MCVYFPVVAKRAIQMTESLSLLSNSGCSNRYTHKRSAGVLPRLTVADKRASRTDPSIMRASAKLQLADNRSATAPIAVRLFHLTCRWSLAGASARSIANTQGSLSLFIYEAAETAATCFVCYFCPLLAKSVGLKRERESREASGSNPKVV